VDLRKGTTQRAPARRNTSRASTRNVGTSDSSIARACAPNGHEEVGRKRGTRELLPLALAPASRNCYETAAELYNSAWSSKVTPWLEKFWSPDEKSRRLHRAFPGEPIMQLSCVTIRQSLHLHGRGELHRELARCLRSSRAEMVGLGHEINSLDDVESS
jgi:hypothetical protein